MATASSSAKLLSMVAFLLLFSAKLTVPLPSNPYCLPQYAHANWACYSVLFDEPADGPSSGDAVEISVDHVKVHHSPRAAAALARRRNQRPWRRGRNDHVQADDDDDRRGDEECCRALEQVDNECVCDALAKLPLFLNAPEHDYHITVGSSCNFTFECGMHGEMSRG